MSNIDKYKFKKGDRVRYIWDKVCLPIYGKTGTVIIAYKGGVGVQFDEYVNGHTCDGIGKNGYCYKLNENHLEKIGDLEIELI